MFFGTRARSFSPMAAKVFVKYLIKWASTLFVALFSFPSCALNTLDFTRVNKNQLRPTAAVQMAKLRKYLSPVSVQAWRWKQWGGGGGWGVVILYPDLTLSCLLLGRSGYEIRSIPLASSLTVAFCLYSPKYCHLPPSGTFAQIHLKCLPNIQAKISISNFQFDRMEDLPENHFRVSGASLVNITNYYKFTRSLSWIRESDWLYYA